MMREKFEQVEFFTGVEVEHSPAHGKRTLFVVGVHAPHVVMAQADLQGCEHIYFGANQSFLNPKVNAVEEWQQWEHMILGCLAHNWLCTLDLDVSAVEGLLETGLCESAEFIPMISVRLPYIQQLGYNAIIKLDDRNFGATNPGVWCHYLHDLQHRSRFTSWDKYTKDQPV